MGTAESDSFIRTHHDLLRKSIWGKYAMHQDSSESTSIQGAKLLVEFIAIMCKVNLMTVEDLRG